MNMKEQKRSYNYINYLQNYCAKKNKNIDCVQVQMPGKKKFAKEFSFEKIFEENQNQESIFEYFQNDLIENSFNGVKRPIYI